MARQRKTEQKRRLKQPQRIRVSSPPDEPSEKPTTDLEPEEE